MFLRVCGSLKCVFVSFSVFSILVELSTSDHKLLWVTDKNSFSSRETLLFWVTIRLLPVDTFFSLDGCLDCPFTTFERNVLTVPPFLRIITVTISYSRTYTVWRVTQPISNTSSFVLTEISVYYTNTYVFSDVLGVPLRLLSLLKSFQQPKF